MTASPTTPHDSRPYCFVSSEKQGENHSIETQLRLCHELATREGYHVPDEYVFPDPARSSKTLDRPKLTQLHVLVRQGTIQAVVLYDIDRLTREHWHSGFLRQALREHRVRLIIVNQLQWRARRKRG